MNAKALEKDILLFGKVFFPHYFTKESAPFHKEVHRLCNSKDNRYISIAAPRGHAKTTNITFLQIMYRLAYRKEKFMIILSDSTQMAYNFADAILSELEENSLFTRYYDLKITLRHVSEQHGIRIEVNNEMCVLSKGFGQSFRGMKWRQARPTLIILDDFENDEVSFNENLREKIKHLFFAKIMPAIDSDKGKIWVIGTILHYDSLLSNLMENNIFKSKLYKAIENGKPLWEAKFTIEDLYKIKESYKQAGKLHLFYQEYLNEPKATEENVFKADSIMYYEEKDIRMDLPYLHTYVLCDPAISSNRTACDTAIVVISVKNNPDESKEYYLRDYFLGKLHPDEIIEKIINFAETYKAEKMGVENVAYQQMLKLELDKVVRNRNLRFIVEGLNPRNRQKDYRILGLQPDWNAGRFFIKKWMIEAEKQFLEFPVGKKKDLIDACAYIKDIDDSVFSYRKKKKNRRKFLEGVLV